MPFKSEAQRRYRYRNLPKIAKRWERENVKEVLPDRLAPKRKRKK